MSKLHLDYSEYKELIGDLGVTEWTKYNWLSGPENPFFGGFKRVDMGTLNWVYGAANSIFYVPNFVLDNNAVPNVNYNSVPSIYTQRYTTGSVNTVVANDKYITLGITGYYVNGLVIKDTSFGSDFSEFKKSLSGVYLTYEVQPQYTELQYIQSNGVQYVNTGYNPNNKSGMKCDFSIDETVSDNFIVGVKEAGDTRFAITRTGSALYCGFGIATPGDRPSVTTGTRVTIENNFLNDRKQKLNGTSFYSINFELPQLTKSVATCGGFYRGDGDFILYCSQTWYNFQLSEGTEVIMNLIPVRRNTDNAVGMYDRVTGQFFGNSGTGVFIAGPEKEIR